MAGKAKEGYLMLKGQILATTILLPFVPFILCLFIGYYHFAASLRDSAEAEMVRVAEDHYRLITMFLAERRADLDFIISTNSFDRLSQTPELAREFQALQKKSEAFVDLGVFDQTGKHLAYVGPYELQGKNYAEETWFKEVLAQRNYTSNIFLGFRRVPHFVIAVARSEEGRTWVVRATIDTQFFTDLVERVRIGAAGEAYIIDRTGVFQTKRRSGGELMAIDPEAAGYLEPHPGVRTFVREDSGGEEFLYATAWLRDDHWVLVVRQPGADAFKSLRSAGLAVLLISVIGGGLIVLAAYLLTNRIIGRMSRIEGEKASLNQQLVVAGRLAELGEMSAGFAHEINNPLQIIQAEQKLIRTLMEEMRARGELKESDELNDVVDSIDQIQVQIDRCASITQSILKFARQKEQTIRVVDLKTFIPEIIGLVRQKIEVEGIGFDQRIDPDVPPIEADPTELQQVLVNLLNNAVDAVVDRHGHQGGRIAVSVALVQEGVELTVTDNGRGIKEEDRQKMFTPFFTTKPVGKGTGLGLSVCFGIIDRLGGHIVVESAEEAGATFRIMLPVDTKMTRGADSAAQPV